MTRLVAAALYVPLLLIFLVSFGFTVFANIVNPPSLTDFFVTIALSVYLIAAAYIGFANYRRPSHGKDIFFFLGLAILVFVLLKKWLGG